MTRSHAAGLALVLLLSSCVHSRGRAPGPELDGLALQAHGTLIEDSSYFPAWPKILLTDLPSMRELEFRLEHQSVAGHTLNESGKLVYARDFRLDSSHCEPLFPESDSRPSIHPSAAIFRLHVVDLANSTEREITGVEDFPFLLELAPRGDLLIFATNRNPSRVHAFDLSTGERWIVEHGVGSVQRCDWLRDGSAFALSGAEGGELIDAYDLTSLARGSEPYGAFSPDGTTYLSVREQGLVLVTLDGSRAPLEILSLPSASVFESLPESRASQALIGMCGARLALYLALPTVGKPVRWQGKFGQPWIRTEIDAIKVLDLDAGSYATVLPAVNGFGQPGWSTVRLELLQP